MIGTIVWLIGLVCAIWCVLDIFKKNISTGGKVIAAVVVLLTSWVGLAVPLLLRPRPFAGVVQITVLCRRKHAADPQRCGIKVM